MLSLSEQLFLVVHSVANIAKKPPNGYLSSVNRRRFRRAWQWAVAVFCLACLVVFLRDTWARWGDVEAALASSLSSPGLMAAELALMAANMVVETLRWRRVRSVFAEGDLLDDIMASLRAVSLGNATPGNVGEHVGRALVYDDLRHATHASLAASVLQTATIALMGAAACAFLWSQGAAVPPVALRAGAVAFVAVFLCLSAAVAVVAYFRWVQVELREGWGGSLVAAAWLNALKVGIFSLQLFLFLRAGSAAGGATLFAAVVFYYYLVTLTPRVNIADIGVKGGLASYVFVNGLCDDAAVTSAVILIWATNIVLPSVIGFASLSFNRRPDR